MSKLADQMRKNLAELEANKDRPVIEAFLKEQEELRTAGMPKEMARRCEIKKAIFEHLSKLCPGDVTFVEGHFHMPERIIVEDYNDYKAGKNEDGTYPQKRKVSSWAGWTEASIRTPYYLYYDIKHEQSDSGSHWSTRRSTFNGKIRIYTGDHGNKSQYKQMKDGTHRYEDIAHDLANQIKKEKAAIEAERVRKQQRNIAQEVVNGIEGYKQYRGVSVNSSSDVNKPVQLVLNTTRNFTKEQAEAILNALKGAGVFD